MMSYVDIFKGLTREEMVAEVLETRRIKIDRLEKQYGTAILNKEFETLIGLHKLERFERNDDDVVYCIINAHRKISFDFIYDFAPIENVREEYNKNIAEMREIGKLKGVGDYVDENMAKELACIMARKSFSMSFEEMLNNSDKFLEHCIEFIDVLRG